MFRNIYGFIFLVAISVLLVACSTTNLQDTNQYNSSGDRNYDQEDNDQLPNNYPTKSLPDGNLWSELRKNFTLAENINAHGINTQINWYRHHQSYIDEVIKHSAPYIYYIYQETKNRGLPAELALIPMIESSYDPFLYSKAGAAGLWQMMPGTASGFGLKINWWYDGRRDLIAATKAALKYITYLHYYFNDNWLLTIAAYDSGEGTVQAAILKNQRNNLPTGFWSLHLPKETKSYLPKLLALAAIIKNPERYHVHLMPINNGPYFAKVDVGSQIDIEQAARLAGVNVTIMRSLNPGFRRWVSDPDGPYTLLVPKEKAKQLTEAIARLSDDNLPQWQKYTVRKSDTLITLARQFHTNIVYLQKINSLRNKKIKENSIILVPIFTPTNMKEEFIASEVNDFATPILDIAAEKTPGPQQVIHTVQPGETTNLIAKKYGVKPSQLLFWNQLDTRDTLESEDELVIWRTLPAENPQKTEAPSFIYKAKAGDTLLGLAKRYKTSVAKLRTLNSLKGNNVKVGQQLKIPGRIGQNVHYKSRLVKRSHSKKNTNFKSKKGNKS
jgi:membrane-bound lytic murein transglycosylase D